MVRPVGPTVNTETRSSGEGDPKIAWCGNILETMALYNVNHERHGVVKFSVFPWQ